MSVGPVNLMIRSHMQLETVASRQAAETVSRQQQEQDDRRQLEFLARRLGALRRALEDVREAWHVRRTTLGGTAAGVSATSDPDRGTLLRDLPGFGAVVAGDIAINGTAVAIDPSADTLADVEGRINAADAGATAGSDGAGRFALTADDPTADLVLGDGGTGLLAALGIAEGTYAPIAGREREGLSTARARGVAGDLREAYRAINAIFDGPEGAGDAPSWLVRARGSLHRHLEQAREYDPRGVADAFGLDFDFEDAEAIDGGFLPDGRRFERIMTSLLRGRADAAESLLFGDGAENLGLIGRLEAVYAATLKSLQRTADGKGLSIDRYV